jgi:glycosyltransferase involved in cell wall biosynthesis
VNPAPEFTSSVWGIHDAQSETDHRPTGCGFYRVVLPLDQLKAHGWKVHYQAFAPPPRIGEYKLVVGERLDRPQVLGAWRRLRQAHKLVYELDDDIWTIDPANAHAHSVYSRHSVQDAVENAITTSDLVTVTREPLAETIRERTGHANVKVIGNYVPGFVLGLERRRREHVTIGWTGGVSHTWDVALIARAVRRVMNTDPSLRLHIVGSDFRPTFGHLHARHTAWEPDPMDYYQHLDFDIGLAPIAATDFNLSKSHLKCLEYAAMGIPVVASDFGAYREFVIDGVTGFLVSKEKHWRDRIRELAADASLRESMGAKARELAAQHTIEKNWHKWAAAYQEVLT